MFFNRKKASAYTILPTSTTRATNGATATSFAPNGTGHRGAGHHRTEADPTVDGLLAAGDGRRELGIASDAMLTLQVQGMSAQMEFPSSTVTALRYMTTRLMVNQALPKRTAVVAALRGEGVTYAALATAALLAHDTTRRICYVDLNWWWPSQLPWQVSTTERGIVAATHQGITLEQALIATNFNNLWLLPAGPVHPSQRATLARSNELTLLLGQLADQFDHLLLDIPAILTTSDAIPLASQADGCCVVVRQGVNTSSLVGKALKEIDHLAMLGVILNRAAHHTPEWLLKWIPQE